MGEENERALNAKELSKVAGGTEAEPAEAKPANTRCPRCGSTNVTTDLALLEYFCEDCGYRWG